MISIEGSVVIPAHNEGAVIGKLLMNLAPIAAAGVQVVVVPNGCLDQTESIAASFEWARIVSLTEGSKSLALNAGDAVATSWPRVYLDADIGLGAETIPSLLRALESGDRPAGRPAFTYDMSGCSTFVRAYFRARNRMPSLQTHLWGAGCYAVTKRGRERFEEFPLDVADDAWVDGLFLPGEKLILTSNPVTVRPPRTLRALLHVLPRVYQGKTRVSNVGDPNRLIELLRSVHDLGSAFDAVIYFSIALAGKAVARLSGRHTWRRDLSSRQPSRPPGQRIR